MLDCYVYAAFSIVMYMLHFLYAGFWRLPSRGGRQNRQKKLKKFLCSSVMFLSWPRNVSSYMFLNFGPRNVRSDMFLDFGRGT
jgi:hypothetical protein